MSSLSAMRKNKLCFFFLHYIHRLSEDTEQVTLAEIGQQIPMKDHEHRAVVQYLTSEALISIDDAVSTRVSLTKWGKEALLQASKVSYSSHFHVGGHQAEA